MYRLSLLASYANEAIEKRSTSRESPAKSYSSPGPETKMHMPVQLNMNQEFTTDTVTRTRTLYCRKCEGHGKQAILKGHAPTCPYNMCNCRSCSKLMSKRLHSFNKRNRSRLEAAAAITASRIATNNSNLEQFIRPHAHSFSSESAIGSLSFGQRSPLSDTEAQTSHEHIRHHQSSSAEPFQSRPSIKQLNRPSSANTARISIAIPKQETHTNLKRCLDAKSDSDSKRPNVDIPTTSGTFIDPNQGEYVTLPTIPAVKVLLTSAARQSRRDSPPATTVTAAAAQQLQLPTAIGIAKPIDRNSHLPNHSLLADTHGLATMVRPTPTVAPSIIRQRVATNQTETAVSSPAALSRPVALSSTYANMGSLSNPAPELTQQPSEQQILNALQLQQLLQQHQQTLSNNNDNALLSSAFLNSVVTPNSLMSLIQGSNQLAALQQASLQSLQNAQAMQKNTYFLQQQQQLQSRPLLLQNLFLPNSDTLNQGQSLSSLNLQQLTGGGSLTLPTTLSTAFSSNYSNSMEQLRQQILLQHHQQQRFLATEETLKLTPPAYQIEQPHPLAATTLAANLGNGVLGNSDPVQLQAMFQHLKKLQQSLAAYNSQPCVT